MTSDRPADVLWRRLLGRRLAERLMVTISRYCQTIFSVLLGCAVLTGTAAAFELPSFAFPAQILFDRHAHDHGRSHTGGQTGHCEEAEIAVTDFVNGSDAPGGAGRAALDAAIRQIEGQSCVVRVIGYASLVGPDTINQQIALARADGVSAYLVSLNLDIDVEAVQGFGATDQFGSRAADNRRVVISFASP